MGCALKMTLPWVFFPCEICSFSLNWQGSLVGLVDYPDDEDDDEEEETSPRKRSRLGS